jgi:hypothetical protein
MLEGEGNFMAENDQVHIQAIAAKTDASAAQATAMVASEVAETPPPPSLLTAIILVVALVAVVFAVAVAIAAGLFKLSPGK